MSGYEAVEIKACPQCGQFLFADMDVCYGCLHDFSREGEPAVGQAFAEAPVRQAVRHAGMGARHMMRHEVSYADMDEPPDMEGAREDATASDGAAAADGDTTAETDAPPPPEPASPAQGDGGLIAPPGTTGEVGLTMPLPQRPPHDGSLALRVQTTAMDVVLPLPAAGLSIGRSPDNDVVLHSRAVSRRHLRLEPSDGGATVLDLGATNPARFRGQEVPSELSLATGETIDVCGAVLTLVRA